MSPNVSVSARDDPAQLVSFPFSGKSTATLFDEEQTTLHFSSPTQQIPLGTTGPSHHEYTFALALPSPLISFFVLLGFPAGLPSRAAVS